MKKENHTIISREEAIKKGLLFYFNGEKCKRGHLSQRYTTSGNCKQCMIDRVKENRNIIIDIRRKINANAPSGASIMKEAF